MRVNRDEGSRESTETGKRERAPGGGGGRATDRQSNRQRGAEFSGNERQVNERERKKKKYMYLERWRKREGERERERGGGGREGRRECVNGREIEEEIDRQTAIILTEAQREEKRCVCVWGGGTDGEGETIV